MKTRFLRWEAPNSEARRLRQAPTYPSRANSPTTLRHCVVNKETWDVLNKNESGSNHPNNAGVLKPKAAASSLDAGTLSCLTEVLAGEASADEVHGLQFVSAYRGDVAILSLRGASASPGRLHCVRVVLDLPLALKTRTIEAKIQTTNSAEEASIRPKPHGRFEQSRNSPRYRWRLRAYDPLT